MALEPGYRRQTAPRPAAAMPAASAESFGAGFGRQLEASTQQVHREQLQDYQIERREAADSEWAAFQHGFALHRENMDGIAREARKDGSGGHAARMREAWEASREGLVDGLKEDAVRQRATSMFEEARGRFVSGEATFEEGARVERVVTDFEAARDIGANRVRRLDKPEDYLAETSTMQEAIGGLNVAEDVKSKLLRETDQVFAVSFLRGRIDEDPTTAKALLTGGAFDDVLEPQQIDALLNRSDLEIRSLEVRAAREAAEAAAAVKEQIQTLEEADRQGIALPDEQYAAAAEAAAALGDDSLALKLEGLRANAGFAKVWEDATPLQREARLAELAGRTKRSAAEDRELKWLEDKSGSLDSRFNDNPAAFAARTGNPPPPLEDPAARAQWARERSAAYGRPVPPLTKNEAAQLQANFRSGRAAAIEVFDMLAAMPADQAAAAAQQIDPNDATMPVVAVLPRQYRQLALDGRDVLKTNAQLIKGALKEDPDLQEAVADFDGRFNDALRAVPPAQRAGILAVGARILAGVVDQSGGEVSADTYWKAMNMALGATGAGADRKGGLGRWGESWFLLPKGVSGEAFGAAVRRAAKTGGPVNPNGSPATLSRTFPVAIGNGTYEFRTASGDPIGAADGGNWIVRVSPQ
jgi:hypothetical protein